MCASNDFYNSVIVVFYVFANDFYNSSMAFHVFATFLYGCLCVSNDIYGFSNFSTVFYDFLIILQ